MTNTCTRRDALKSASRGLAHLRKAEAAEADKSFHQGVTINLFRLHQVGLYFYWVKSNQLMEIVNNELKKVSSWFQANYKLSINIKESNQFILFTREVIGA